MRNFKNYFPIYFLVIVAWSSSAESYDTDKIGNGLVVELDCGKNVKGAVTLIREFTRDYTNPPYHVILKNISNTDVYLVTGPIDPTGYLSESGNMTPGKERTFSANKNGKWYAVYANSTDIVNDQGEWLPCNKRLHEVADALLNK